MADLWEAKPGAIRKVLAKGSFFPRGSACAGCGSWPQTGRSAIGLKGKGRMCGAVCAVRGAHLPSLGLLQMSRGMQIPCLATLSVRHRALAHLGQDTMA